MTSVEATTERTRKIREIVLSRTVETQAELVAALRHQRIRVTQATISRDIKRLGLVKVPVANGRYRYALPGAAREATPQTAQRLRAVFEEFATSVERGLDLVLVKTVPGGASPVAEAIDDMRWPEVAGTVAGENTIIVVPRSRRGIRAVLRRLHGVLRGRISL